MGNSIIARREAVRSRYIWIPKSSTTKALRRLPGLAKRPGLVRHEVGERRRSNPIPKSTVPPQVPCTSYMEAIIPSPKRHTNSRQSANLPVPSTKLLVARPRPRIASSSSRLPDGPLANRFHYQYQVSGPGRRRGLESTVRRLSRGAAAPQHSI